MRSVILIAMLILCCSLTVYGQNLVPNPSFEEYYSCPTGTSQLDTAIGWKNYGVKAGSPDYFNACSKDSVANSSQWYIMAGVPENAWGNQISKSGDGYAGFCTYHTDTTFGAFREIIGIKLTEPLEIDTTYYVSFWVSPGYGRYFGSKWFSNKTGARFSMQEYDGHWQSTNPAPIDNFAHVFTDSIFSDTTKWHLISGSFVADKPYPYLMLGNFFDNNQTSIITNGIQNYAAYYYIDQVCVSKSNNQCIETPDPPDTTDPGCDQVFNIYPNPAKDIVWISIPCESLSLHVYDAIGRLVYKISDIDENTTILDVPSMRFSSGTYFALLNTPTQDYIGKFIIIH